MTNNTPTTNIYQLIDPRTGDVFYIGQAVNPAKRLEQHINDARPNDKRQRIADMLADGVEPVLQVVEVVARKDADKAERRRIKELDGLTNKNHNGKKRKRNRRKKPKTAHLVPAVRAYHAKERKSREVPEIAQASWKKIKPMLDKSNAVSTHELSEWAEVT
ncbi:MAG: GIY-YIG nuclease family protein, partial [Anaerolineales bacterium]|nr:GIY-YIG nuclease family protein [Anaerolineales bacterium]